MKNMINTTLKSVVTLTLLGLSVSVFAEQAMVLNRNFDSDSINPAEGKTSTIAGWVKSGTGTIGVEIPQPGSDYSDMGDRGQSAFLHAGGRFYQKPGAKLIAGETYTLSFDVGRDFSQSGLDVIARLKANGLALAQLQLDSSDVPTGQWATHQLSFTATETMPLEQQLSIEFQNFAQQAGYKAHIDNVYLQTSSKASLIQPGSVIPKTLTIIDSATTINVPEDHANITLALDALSDKYITNTAKVTIKVNDCGDQVYYQPIKFVHPHGKRIEIIGNLSTPSACVLQFNGVNGFNVANRNTLGLINGFHIRGNATNNTYGINATNGALVFLGASMHVSNFHHGLRADLKAHVYAGKVLSSLNTGSGFLAMNGGLIFARESQSHSNSTHGYWALNGGEMYVISSKAYNNTNNGYMATNHGYIRAQSSEAKDNGNIGFYAQNLSFIRGYSSKSLNNRGGYFCEYQSYMEIGSHNQSGNQFGTSPGKDQHNNYRCGMNY